MRNIPLTYLYSCISLTCLSSVHASTEPTNVAAGVVNISGVTMDNNDYNKVSNFGLVAIGNGNKSSSTHAVTIGQSNTASGPFSVAIGSSATSNGNSAIAVGRNASAKQYSIVMGKNSVGEEGSVAIGDSSQAAYTSVAVGPSSFATGKGSIAIGARASGTNTVAIGGQANAEKEYSVALGKFANATGVRSLAEGFNSKSIADYAVSIGALSSSEGIQSVSFGAVSSAKQTGGVSVGSFSSADGFKATTVGYGAKSEGARTTALGAETEANGTASSAIGFQAVANATDSVALGSNSNAKSTRSTALGSLSTSTVEDGVALGSMSSANRAAGATDAWISEGGVKDNTATWVSTSGAVSLGGEYNGETKTRQITNVAAGSADSDAANVAQLKQLDHSISQRITNITANSKYFKANSSEVSPVPSGKNSIAVGPVAQAEADESIAIGHNATVSKKAPEGSVVLGNNAKAEAAHTGQYSINKARVAGKSGKTTPVISVGHYGNERQIQNVAPGVVSESSTDAVNGSQLYATNQQVSRNTADINQLGNKFNQLDSRIDGLNKDIRGVGASAAAMSAIPQAYLPGKSLLGLGVGGYGGESAMALGISTISDNGKVILKMNAGQNTRGNLSVGAGIGYQW